MAKFKLNAANNGMRITVKLEKGESLVDGELQFLQTNNIPSVVLPYQRKSKAALYVTLNRTSLQSDIADGIKFAELVAYLKSINNAVMKIEMCGLTPAHLLLNTDYIMVDRVKHGVEILYVPFANQKTVSIASFYSYIVTNSKMMDDVDKTQRLLAFLAQMPESKSINEYLTNLENAQPVQVYARPAQQPQYAQPAQPVQEEFPETLAYAPVQEEFPETLAYAPEQEEFPETLAYAPEQEEFPETLAYAPEVPQAQPEEFEKTVAYAEPEEFEKTVAYAEPEEFEKTVAYAEQEEFEKTVAYAEQEEFEKTVAYTDEQDEDEFPATIAYAPEEPQAEQVAEPIMPPAAEPVAEPAAPAEPPVQTQREEFDKTVAYAEPEEFAKTVAYEEPEEFAKTVAYAEPEEFQKTIAYADEPEPMEFPETIAYAEPEPLPETVAYADPEPEPMEFPETIAYAEPEPPVQPQPQYVQPEPQFQPQPMYQPQPMPTEEEYPETVSFTEEAEEEYPETVSFTDEADDEYPETVALTPDNMYTETPSTFSKNERFVAKLIRIKTNEAVYITKPNFIIGKDAAKCDFCVTGNPTVSRRHASVTIRSKNDCYITDLNSSNHTFVDGVQLTPNAPARMFRGSRVYISNEEFLFDIE